MISGEEITNVYQVIVEKINEDIEPFDKKVSKTIEDIIEKFFRNIDNSLIYVCIDNDEKGKLRFEIFNRWYKNSKHQQYILKIDNVFKFQTNKIYTSFMFHKSNLNFKKLIGIYNKIEEILNEEK